MKKKDLVREYVKSLSDDELFFISSRYSQKLAGDWAEIAYFLSKSRSIDGWLSSAKGSHEWFEMVDDVGEEIQSEFRYRDDKASKGNFQ